MFHVDETRIGERSDKALTEVEKGAIRRFAAALGERDPRYFDEDAARSAGFRSLVAPPTFLVTLARHPAPGLEMPRAGTIHGEQHFTYGAPIVAGDVIAVQAWLDDVKVRNGSRGRMTILTVASEGVNQEGAFVFRARSTLIVNEGVS